MHAYIYFIKLRILASFQYRIEAIGGLISNIVPLFTMVFLWRSGFKSTTLVNGVSESQMITYSIMALGLKDLFFFQVQDSLLKGVREGSIAIDLGRPYNLLLRYFAEDTGLLISTIFRRFFPLIIFSAIFIQMPSPSSLLALLLTIISLAASFGILWILSALTGLLSLWTMELGNLGMVKDALIRVLSGSIVPIWFFSDKIQFLSKFLPFQYTYQTPLAIYIGELNIGDSLGSILIQLFWLAGLLLALSHAWNRVNQYTAVQGG